MSNQILALENRIDTLTKRDPVGNYALIQKAKRRLRKLQNENK